MSDKINVKKDFFMENTHSFRIRVSKHSQRNSCPIPFLFPFSLLQLTLTICYHFAQLLSIYKKITCYLVMLISSMFPATIYTCQPHVPNIKKIISMNLKSTFTRTNNHVIIYSQLIVIRHNDITVTYYTQVHMNCLNTYVLVQSS